MLTCVIIKCRKNSIYIRICKNDPRVNICFDLISDINLPSYSLLKIHRPKINNQLFNSLWTNLVTYID